MTSSTLGDVTAYIEEFKCPHCGAPLTPPAGAVAIERCPFCGVEVKMEDPAALHPQAAAPAPQTQQQARASKRAARSHDPVSWDIVDYLEEWAGEVDWGCDMSLEPAPQPLVAASAALGLLGVVIVVASSLAPSYGLVAHLGWTTGALIALLATSMLMFSTPQDHFAVVAIGMAFALAGANEALVTARAYLVPGGAHQGSIPCAALALLVSIPMARATYAALACRRWAGVNTVAPELSRGGERVGWTIVALACAATMSVTWMWGA